MPENRLKSMRKPVAVLLTVTMLVASVSLVYFYATVSKPLPPNLPEPLPTATPQPSPTSPVTTPPTSEPTEPAQTSAPQTTASPTAQPTATSYPTNRPAGTPQPILATTPTIAPTPTPEPTIRPTPTPPVTPVTAPAGTWTYGGPDYDDTKNVFQSADNGIIIAGRTRSFGQGAWLLKLDANSRVQQNKTILGELNGNMPYTIPTRDGAYAAAWGDTTMDLVKTDSFGNVTWRKTIVSSGMINRANGVLETSDNGFFIYGIYGAGSAAGGVVAETDENGTKQWEKGTITGIWASELGAVETSDGGYATTGYYQPFSFVSSPLNWNNMTIHKLSSTGTKQWELVVQPQGNVSYGLSIVEANDRGLVAAGYVSTEGNYDVLLVKTDANGTLLSIKTYGGTLREQATVLIKTKDGGYAILGYTATLSGDEDMLLIKTDANGNLQWNKTYGGPGDERGAALLQNADGGYMLVGSTTSYGAGGSDIWLLKTDSEGNIIQPVLLLANVPTTLTLLITATTTFPLLKIFSAAKIKAKSMKNQKNPSRSPFQVVSAQLCMRVGREMV
jgi:hypothetical protein